MNVGIGNVAVQCLFWEYLFRIFGIMSLQCSSTDWQNFRPFLYVSSVLQGIGLEHDPGFSFPFYP
jgi:hypothetical protein